MNAPQANPLNTDAEEKMLELLRLQRESYLAEGEVSAETRIDRLDRTIDVLVKNRLVRKMDLGDGRSLFEPRLDDEHHDHMICLETGDIIEFYNKELEDLQDAIAKKYGYKVIRHVHQLFVKPIK